MKKYTLLVMLIFTSIALKASGINRSFEDFPDEIVCAILNFINPPQIFNTSLASTKLAGILQEITNKRFTPEDKEMYAQSILTITAMKNQSDIERFRSFTDFIVILLSRNISDAMYTIIEKKLTECAKVYHIKFGINFKDKGYSAYYGSTKRLPPILIDFLYQKIKVMDDYI